MSQLDFIDYWGAVMREQNPLWRYRIMRRLFHKPDDYYKDYIL